MALKLRLGNALRSAADKALQSRATDHFLAPGEEVELGRSLDANMGALVLRGFAAPEDDGIWSAGSECRVDIRMRAVRVDRRYRVALTAIPFEGAGHRALVSISVNGGSAHQIMSSGSGWQQIEVEGQLGGGRSPGISLVFHVANPMSPSALGMGEDHRLLGLKLRSIKVIDVGSAEQVGDAVPLLELPQTPQVASDVSLPGADADALISVEEASVPPSGEAVHVPANRGSLWRKILLDKNPLVRVVRWMRRVTHSLQSMERQLDHIRQDSARQARELAQQIGVIENDVRKIDVKQTQVRTDFESAIKLLQANHERLLAIEIAVHAARELQEQHYTHYASDLSAVVSSYSNLARSHGEVLQMQARVQQAQHTLVSSFDAMQTKMQAIDARIAQLSGEHERRFVKGVGELSKRQIELLQKLATFDERQQRLSQAANEQISSLSQRIDLLSSVAVSAQSMPTSVDDIHAICGLLTAAHEKLDSTGISVGQVLQVASTTSQTLDRQSAQMDALPSFLVATISGIVAGQNRRVLRTNTGWIISTSFGRISCDEKDDLLAMCLAEWGDVERGLRLFLQRNLMPGDVFVDVGANVGLHTVVAATRVGPGGRVIAFEAVPRTVEHLRASLRLSDVEAWVEVHTVAVGAREEEGRVFHVAAIAGHSSMYPLQEAVLEQVMVPVRTLDGVLSGAGVKLVKIDVEGAELDVLQGMAQLIEQNPRLGIIAEYALSHLDRVGASPGQWEDFRRRYGFDLYLIDDLTGTCQKLQGFDAIKDRISSNVLLCRDEANFVLHEAAGGAE